jgi:hypothetical protein
MFCFLNVGTHKCRFFKAVLWHVCEADENDFEEDRICKISEEIIQKF